jgi:uncharacterized protein (TIGR02266 family)
MDQPSSTESNAITLRIRFKSPSLDEFINRYGVDVSPGGIFIRTKQPVEVGTSLQFEFTLADGAPLLTGLGTVAWVRENDPSRANNVPGMGLRFDKLSAESQHTHQTILAEKARKEGKASVTPYPPTAFVAATTRPSPAPDVARPATQPPKTEPVAPTNFAVTRPAPAAVVKPAPSAVAPAQETSADTEDFEGGGKTEVTDTAFTEYMKEMKEAETGKRSAAKPPEEGVPTSLLEDWNTDSASLPITKSSPPPRSVLAEEQAVSKSEAIAPESKSLSGERERKSGNRAIFESLLDLGEPGPSADAGTGTPNNEVLEEISAGAPIEETLPEKTEELSVASAVRSAMAEDPVPPIAAPEPFDLASSPLGDDRPPSMDGAPSLKRKGSGKLIAGIAVLAAAAAFGAMYLIKTKPWQSGETASTAASAPSEPAPAPPPAPAPVAAEPAGEAAKPAAPSPAEAKKPASPEEKPAVAEKKEPEKNEKAVAKEKAPEEKPAEKKAPAPAVAAKAEGEPARERSASKSSSKSSGAAKWGDDNPSDDKATPAAEEVYRLVVKSSPINAEVLIDGDYFARTPCERRILDPSKPISLVIQRQGYDPHERVLGPSDNWAKKGRERVLTVFAALKKSKKPATSATESTGSAAAAGSEASAKKEAEPAPAAKPEPVKLAPAPAAEPKPVPAKAEPAKPAPAPATEKAPAPGADKASQPMFKPVPNFGESGKAGE